MKLYLKSGQIVEIDGVSEVSTICSDYVKENKLGNLVFEGPRLLRDCQEVREDNDLVNELISFYDNTGYRKFMTVMDQIIGIEED